MLTRPSSRRWTRQSVILILLAGIGLILVYSHYDNNPHPFLPSKTLVNVTFRPGLPLKPEAKPTVGPYHPSRVLKGPPTESFRGRCTVQAPTMSLF